MNHDIEAIFLDVGNTLRIVIEDPEFSQNAMQELMTLVGAKEPQAEFFLLVVDDQDHRFPVHDSPPPVGRAPETDGGAAVHARPHEQELCRELVCLRTAVGVPERALGFIPRAAF